MCKKTPKQTGVFNENKNETEKEIAYCIVSPTLYGVMLSQL